MRLITLSLFATLLSAPAFAADLGTYRPGTPYSSTAAGGADVCDSHCAGDAQCRGWNYVKPNPRAAGICEFLSSVSTPISSPISISGASETAGSFSSRVSSGGTNTIRVGTQPTPRSNTVRVGQSDSGRQIIHQAAPQRIAPQRASTRPVANMSLTEQQNMYRNGQVGVPQRATQPKALQPQRRAPQPQPQAYAARQQAYAAQQQAYAVQQRQIFRPILDGSAPQFSAQGQIQPQISQTKRQIHPQASQEQRSRRATGPRRQRGQNQALSQGSPVPQFQDPRAQAPQVQGQNFPPQPYQGQKSQAPQQIAERGQSRPPVGQTIPAPQRPVRPKPSTPSQRLAHMTAKTRSQASTVSTNGPVALSPAQARKSLFGSLNDDLQSSDLPTASAVPTLPVTEQPLGEVLAGGL